MKIKLLMIILVVGINSCISDYSEYAILKELVHVGDNEKEIIYLLPLDGCSYCINQSIQFAKDNIHNKKIHFIITNAKGVKKIKLELGEDLFNSAYVDIENKLVKERLVNISPLVFFIEETRIIKQETVSPTNIQDIFHKILIYVGN